MVVLEVESSDSDSSVIDTGFTESWIFNGVAIGETISETREWDLLEVDIRYSEDQQDRVDSLTGASSKVEVLEVAEGGFRGVDLSNGDNSIQFEAPTTRSEVRPINSWLLDDFSRDVINRDGTVFELTLEMVPEREKAFDNQYGTFDTEPAPSKGSNEWFFDFQYGAIATRRVSADTSGSSEGSNELIDLTLVLRPQEVRVFEEAVSHLNLAEIRSVPDTRDVVDDSSFDGRNTVSLQTPNQDGQPIPDGDYMFRSWETEWIGGAYEATWELVSL